MEIIMKKYNLTLPLFSLLLGGIFLSSSPAYSINSSSNQEAPRKTRPGISGDVHESSAPNTQSTRQKKMAYMDERDQDIHHRANRRGEWGYKQNYRYDREAFYKGETQGEAYDLENPDSAGGIGMDPDVEYLEMRKFYLKDQKGDGQNNPSSKKDPNQKEASSSDSKSKKIDQNDNCKPRNCSSYYPSNCNCYYPNGYDQNYYYPANHY